MRMGQGVRTSLGHWGITCVLQRQFSSFVFNFPKVYLKGYCTVFQHALKSLEITGFVLS